MRGFEPVTLTWKGKQFTVPADRQLLMIAQIEDALAGSAGNQAINVLLRPHGPPHSRLAAAYGAALRYADAKVTDAEIYLDIMAGLAKNEAAAATEIQIMLVDLISVIAPPIGLELRGGQGVGEDSASGETFPEEAS